MYNVRIGAFMKRFIIPTLFATALIFSGVVSIAANLYSVDGNWDGVFNTPGGARPFKVELKADGEKLSGTVKRSSGDVPLIGTIKGNDITFAYTISYNGNDLTMSFTGKVDSDKMSGTVSFGGNAEEEWSAKRVSPAKPKTD